MKRSSFIKSLIAVIVAPKILSGVFTNAKSTVEKCSHIFNTEEPGCVFKYNWSHGKRVSVIRSKNTPN